MNKESGSPYDRGSADSYYSRPRSPHYYSERKRVEYPNMTQQMVDEYHAGYDDNERDGGKKDYG